jgi:hypothetical protein
MSVILFKSSSSKIVRFSDFKDIIPVENIKNYDFLWWSDDELQIINNTLIDKLMFIKKKNPKLTYIHIKNILSSGKL